MRKNLLEITSMCSIVQNNSHGPRLNNIDQFTDLTSSGRKIWALKHPASPLNTTQLQVQVQDLNEKRSGYIEQGVPDVIRQHWKSPPGGYEWQVRVTSSVTWSAYQRLAVDDAVDAVVSGRSQTLRLPLLLRLQVTKRRTADAQHRLEVTVCCQHW